MSEFKTAPDKQVSGEWESESECHSVVSVSDSLRTHALDSPWNSSGQNTGVGSLSLLQGIFPTQGLNPGLPHCRRILYQLNFYVLPLRFPVVTIPGSSETLWYPFL